MSFGRSADTGETAAELPGWRHIYSGKVREVYESESDPAALLLVASDRVSAFDQILSPAIPGKGALLTALTRFWIAELGIPSHLREPEGWDAGLPAELAARSMRAARLEMLPIECVVRGYLTGSGWKEYQASGTVCGIALPAGLSDGDRLPEPIFTPAFKAQQGDHDENISFERCAEIVGADRAEQLRERSLDVFARASAVAESRGLVLADTKLEWGLDPATGELTLGDEVLTSDSSRYWDGEAYADEARPLGERLASFDKQIVRDWLAASWDRQGDPPALPPEVVATTQARYRELASRLGLGLPA